MTGDPGRPVLLVVLRTPDDVALAGRQLQRERIPYELREAPGGQSLHVAAVDEADAQRALGAYGLLGSFVAPAAPGRPVWRVVRALAGLGVAWLTAPIAITAFRSGQPAFYHPTKWSPMAGWMLTLSMAAFALAGVGLAVAEGRRLVIERRQARDRARRDPVQPPGRP